jgi:hypothetical protein
MRGFFAALRMTTEKAALRMTTEKAALRMTALKDLRTDGASEDTRRSFDYVTHDQDRESLRSG